MEPKQPAPIPMPIKPAPHKVPVKRDGIYIKKDGIEEIVYTCTRWEHYVAEGSGIRIYATKKDLCDQDCVITGYSIKIHKPPLLMAIPGEFPECEPGYVKVCTPDGSHCWCEWEGISDP